MTIDWVGLKTYVYDNRLAILSGLGLLGSSAIKTLPLPGSPFQMYTWFYDWSHQFLNITNTRLNTTPVITPPASKEELASVPKVS